MHSTPSNDHTPEFEELAALSALGTLEGDELARFQEHATRCERCRLMVRLDREAVRRLALSVLGMDPSPDFKERLMRRASEELEAPTASTAPETPRSPPTEPLAHTPRLVEPTQPRARPANVLAFRSRSPWMGTLAAVFVVAIVTAGAFAYQNQAVATFQLTGTAAGTATVVVRRSGAAELDMHGVPAPDPGFVYEAWIIPPGAKPMAAGTTSSGDTTLKLSGALQGATVAITRERGEVPAPTGEPIMATTVQL